MASQIGTMLLRAGLAQAGDIERARTLAAASGRSMAESVVEAGITDEEALAAFLQSRLLIPQVSPPLLQEVPEAVTALLPAEQAHRLGAMPVSLDDEGNLTVAMIDPTDGNVVDDLAGLTGKYIIRAVCVPSALRAALIRHYGPAPEPGRSPGVQADVTEAKEPSPEAALPSPSPGPVSADRATVPIPSEDEALPGAKSPAAPRSPAPRNEPSPPATSTAQPPASPAATRRPWQPPLVPSTEEPEPLSAEAFGRVIPRIVAANSSEDIARIVLDFLGAGFRRVILFVHAHGELRGKEARGRDLDLEAVRLVRIPSTQPSLFARVIASRRAHFGPLRPESPIDQAFSAAFGGLKGNILLLPVVLRDKVPVVIFASGTSYPVDPRSIQELADGVSAALERIIMRRKSGSPTS